MRKIYIYRLRVTYPPRAFSFDFEPENWDGDGDPDAPGFRWPRARRYFSATAAGRRAALLRSWGCAVEIERSQPVRWGPE